jgi:hypothetical protein
MRRGGALLLGSLAVALIAASVVLAVNPSKEKIAYTAAGQAKARAEVVRQTDLGRGWIGGPKKPDVSSAMPCSYQPKQSDLTLIGAAETVWHAQGFVVDSEAQVLRTAGMVALDWQRTVLAPQVVPCLRDGFQKSVGTSGTLVSFRRVAFAHVARYTRAFRAVIDVKTSTSSVPVELDFLALGGGRNEITLTLTGPAATEAVLRGAELRLARILAGRMRP